LEKLSWETVMLWLCPSWKRNSLFLLILLFGSRFSFGATEQDEQTPDLSTSITIQDTLVNAGNLVEQSQSVNSENKEKLDPQITSEIDGTLTNNSLEVDTNGSSKENVGIIEKAESDVSEIKFVKPPEIFPRSPRAKLREYINTDLDDEQSQIWELEVLERLNVLHREIENLKKMQQPEVKNVEKMNRAVDEEEDSTFNGRDDDELLAEAQDAQAETSKRKWVPQAPSPTPMDSNFWGWVIGISIILVFLALGATFIAIRTYW
jgi:hypothetical protein